MNPWKMCCLRVSSDDSALYKLYYLRAAEWQLRAVIIHLDDCKCNILGQMHPWETFLCYGRSCTERYEPYLLTKRPFPVSRWESWKPKEKRFGRAEDETDLRESRQERFGEKCIIRKVEAMQWPCGAGNTFRPAAAKYKALCRGKYLSLDIFHNSSIVVVLDIYQISKKVKWRWCHQLTRIIFKLLATNRY